MEPSESINYSIISLRQKIIFVGDSGVGKTTLINRINNEEFKDLNESSVGIDYYSKNIKFGGEELTLQIWDTAGQEKYRGLIPTYARNAVLAFIIYDISSKKSFENLTEWINYLNSIEKMPMIICGNKIDLVVDRQVTKEEGEKFAKKNNLVFFEVSAKTNKNMNYMLYRSIAELPYFEGKNENKDKLTVELLKENGITNDNDILNMYKQNSNCDNDNNKKKNKINNNNKVNTESNMKKEVKKGENKMENNESDIPTNQSLYSSNIRNRFAIHTYKRNSNNPDNRRCHC